MLHFQHRSQSVWDSQSGSVFGNNVRTSAWRARVHETFPSDQRRSCSLMNRTERYSGGRDVSWVSGVFSVFLRSGWGLVLDVSGQSGLRRSRRLAGVSPMTRSHSGRHSRRCVDADAAAGQTHSSVCNLSRRSHRTWDRQRKCHSFPYRRVLTGYWPVTVSISDGDWSRLSLTIKP